MEHGTRLQLCPNQIDAPFGARRKYYDSIPQMLTVLHLSFVQRYISHRQLRSSAFTPDTVPIRNDTATTLFLTRATALDSVKPLSSSYYCTVTERRPFPGPGSLFGSPTGEGTIVLSPLNATMVLFSPTEYGIA